LKIYAELLKTQQCDDEFIAFQNIRNHSSTQKPSGYNIVVVFLSNEQTDVLRCHEEVYD